MDTEWTHWPEPDVSFDRDFESMSGAEMALDHDQNLWMVAQDKGAYMVPAPFLYSIHPDPTLRVEGDPSTTPRRHAA